MKGFSLTAGDADFCMYLNRSNQLTYRLLTHLEVVPYDIAYIVQNCQSN